jgi:hypothetical protein
MNDTETTDHHAEIVVDSNGPRAQEFTTYDPAAPIIGKWYWYAPPPSPKPSLATEDAPENTTEDATEDAPESVFVCVVHVGSNYVKIQGLGNGNGSNSGRMSTPSWRIHLDSFRGLCAHEPNPEGVIQTNTARHQKTALAIMQEVKEVTARLMITPGLGLPGARSLEGQATSLVLSKGKSAEEYTTALELAQEKTLPGLFEKIRQEHAEMSMWMGAKLVPLQAASDAMAPTITAIRDRLFSVELYAGLSEEVEMVHDGAPAPLQEKIRIFQRRAYMDEECLAAYEVGGMEFKDIGAFDKWLCRPSNLERLLPFPRCLLAFQVRRNTKHREIRTYEDFIRVGDLAKLDKLTFLYIRNGERVYRLSTTVNFETQLFPDLQRNVHDGGALYAARGHDPSDVERQWHVIDESELEVMHETHEAHVKEWETKTKDIPDQERWMKFGSGPVHRSPADAYTPFDHTNVYYDDIAADIAADITRHNRLVLVIQGILDRSEALHPHPPWSLWNQDSFRQAIELIYDDVRALTPGDAPDFAAYSQALRAQLKVGDVTIGQHAVWQQLEADKKEDKDTRYRTSHGNKGPGKLAYVVALKGTRATFQWTKKRRGHEYDSEEKPGSPDVGVKLSVHKAHLFNVSAYRPGDFKRFFADPRTRADYLQWAPLLLTAEEFHAGNRQVAPVKPLPARKERVPGGSYEYQQVKARKAWLNKAVRLLRDVSMRNGNVNKKNTLWRISHARKSGFEMVEIDSKGVRINKATPPSISTNWMMGISKYYFEEAPEVPAEPKEEKPKEKKPKEEKE